MLLSHHSNVYIQINLYSHDYFGGLIDDHLMQSHVSPAYVERRYSPSEDTLLILGYLV